MSGVSTSRAVLGMTRFDLVDLDFISHVLLEWEVCNGISMQHSGSALRLSYCSHPVSQPYDMHHYIPSIIIPPPWVCVPVRRPWPTRTGGGADLENSHS